MTQREIALALARATAHIRPTRTKAARAAAATTPLPVLPGAMFRQRVCGIGDYERWSEDRDDGGRLAQQLAAYRAR